MGDVTQALASNRAGDSRASEKLLSVVYAELRRIVDRLHAFRLNHLDAVGAGRNSTRHDAKDFADPVGVDYDQSRGHWVIFDQSNNGFGIPIGTAFNVLVIVP